MRPHPQDADDALLRQHLVDEPMLKVDPPRAGAGEITEEVLVRRRAGVGVANEQREQTFDS